MKKLNSAYIFLGLSVIILLISSCRKDRDNDRDWGAAMDNAMAESYFNDLKSMADEAERGIMLMYRAANDTFVSGCATVIRDTTGPVKTITIDFGTVNCQCNDGKARRGKVIVSFNGYYRDSGTVITHTPDSYFVNDNQLLGSKTVTNKGRNGGGNLWFEVVVSGQVIKANNGGTVTWNSTRQREWIAGENTVLNWLDDVYLITGNASGVRSNGESFTASILIPLRIELSCRYIVKGSIQINPANHSSRLVDYGNGSCDNQATVTINGNTYNITLP